MGSVNSELPKESVPKRRRSSGLQIPPAPVDWRETRAGEVLTGLRETEFNLIHLIKKEAGPAAARKALMWFINGNIAKLEKMNDPGEAQEKL